MTTAPPSDTLVVRYHTSFTDQEIDDFAEQLVRTGLPIALLPAGARAGVVEVLYDLSVQVGTEAMVVVAADAAVAFWHAVTDAVRRHREAGPPVAHPPLRIELPGPVTIVVPDDGFADTMPLLWTQVRRASAAGTLTPGVWRWDPATQRLVAARQDPGPLPQDPG